MQVTEDDEIYIWYNDTSNANENTESTEAFKLKTAEKIDTSNTYKTFLHFQKILIYEPLSFKYLNFFAGAKNFCGSKKFFRILMSKDLSKNRNFFGNLYKIAEDFFCEKNFCIMPWHNSINIAQLI